MLDSKVYRSTLPKFAEETMPMSCAGATSAQLDQLTKLTAIFHMRTIMTVMNMMVGDDAPTIIFITVIIVLM